MKLYDSQEKTLQDAAALPAQQRIAPEVSIFLPVYNEEPNLPPLHAKLDAAFKALGRTAEIIYVDDGRRWLLAHPSVRYDAIVANTTFNWRDHSTGLLSVEFLTLSQ